jgi:hypothetical protein
MAAKKIVFAIIAFWACLALVACGSSGSVRKTHGGPDTRAIDYSKPSHWLSPCLPDISLAFGWPAYGDGRMNALV